MLWPSSWHAFRRASRTGFFEPVRRQFLAHQIAALVVYFSEMHDIASAQVVRQMGSFLVSASCLENILSLFLTRERHMDLQHPLCEFRQHLNWRTSLLGAFKLCLNYSLAVFHEEPFLCHRVFGLRPLTAASNFATVINHGQNEHVRCAALSNCKIVLATRGCLQVQHVIDCLAAQSGMVGHAQTVFLRPCNSAGGAAV